MKPNGTKTGLLWIIFFPLLLAMGLGCATEAEKKAAHQERAKQYIEKQRFKEAVIELNNVIQLDPNDEAAHYQLGEVYFRLRQGDEAFQSFSRAAFINPNNLEAQVKMGQLRLLFKRTEEARDKAELVLEKSSDHIDALYLLALVQIEEQDLDAAFKRLEHALLIHPYHFDTQLLLARLHALQGDLASAEEAYLSAIPLNPSSRTPYVELSAIYRKKEMWDEAELQLRRLVQVSEVKHQDLQILAHFYEDQNKWEQAEKIFLEAVVASPKKDVSALVNMGKYYARRGTYDKALQILLEAAEIKKDDLDILTSIAQVHFDTNRPEEAQEIVDRALKKDKGHVNANFLKGRLCLTKRDFHGASERFDTVLRERPRSAMARYFRALSLIGKGDAKLAQQDLLEALEVDPEMLDARLVLADIYARQGNKKLARQQIDYVSKRTPLDARILTLQGNLRVLEQDIQGAESAFKKVVELKPDYVPGYFRLGLFYNLIKQKEDALESFQKALDIDPQYINALAFMIGIYMQDKKLDEAFRICEEHRQKSEGNASTLAFITYTEGSLYLAKENMEKAIQWFEKAIEIDPSLLAPYVALAKAYGQLGKYDEAISKYEIILAKSPNYLAGHMALGTIYDHQGASQKAESHYRKALEINKDFAPAANNLAWHLAMQGGNIDEALSYAQSAKEKMPKSAAVMDTLGWIYYLKGRYLSAIAELRDSVELAPDNPMVHYHLGLAYYKNNQQDEAGTFLKKALELAPDFAGAEEARRVLEGIEGSRASG